MTVAGDFAIRNRVSHITPGERLTQVERETLLAITVWNGGTLPQLAETLYIHPNTLKYRLHCIRAKLGLKLDAGLGITLWAALEAGLVIPQASLAEQVLRDFVAEIGGRLPAGSVTPVSAGLLTWLQGEVTRYLDARRVELAA